MEHHLKCAVLNSPDVFKLVLERSGLPLSPDMALKAIQKDNLPTYLYIQSQIDPEGSRTRGHFALAVTTAAYGIIDFFLERSLVALSDYSQSELDSFFDPGFPEFELEEFLKRGFTFSVEAASRVAHEAANMNRLTVPKMKTLMKLGWRPTQVLIELS